MGSIATSLTNATGGYSATGAYSIEFLKRTEGKSSPNIPFGEYFFLLGLTRMDHSYTYNVSVSPTYNGAQVVDNGNGISQISLAGEIYAHYTGAPVRKPRSGFAAVGQGLLNTLEGVNPIKKSGYLDFFDLVYLMHEIRDKNKYDSRVPTPSLFYPNGFDIRATAATSLPFNAEETQMIFHDYDRDCHWEVAFDKNGFKISQSKEDPHTWYWSLNFIGVSDESGRGKDRRSPLPDTKALISDARNALTNVLSPITGFIGYFAKLTELYQDIATLAESMKLDLDNFESQNKESLRKISKAGGPLRKKTNDFQNLLIQLLFPNETVPNSTLLDSPSTPKSTSSSEAILNQPEYPESMVTNVLTTEAPRSAEFDAAVDQSVLAITNLQIALGSVSTALMLEFNKDVSNNYGYITFKPGDSIESLANLYYGSPERIDLVYQTDPSLVGKSNEDLIGKKIKVLSKATYNQNDTGVFTERFIVQNQSAERTQKIIEGFLFGEDLALSQDRDFETKAGDLGTTQGIDCLVDGLLDKMKLLPGQIPVHPGIGSIPKPGSVPDDFLNLVIPKKILEDIQTDLGVETAELTEFEIDSDTISYTVKISPIGDFKSFKLRRVRGLSE